MATLALDFGRKRIGVALSRSETLITPLPAWQLTSAAALVAQLQQLITDEKITTLVIGSGIMQPSLKPWLSTIKKGVAIPVLVVSEEESTHEAQQHVGTTTHHADSTAAAIILERYLQDLLQ